MLDTAKSLACVTSAGIAVVISAGVYAAGGETLIGWSSGQSYRVDITGQDLQKTPA